MNQHFFRLYSVNSSSCQRGFSLVEVVLALGIVALTVVTVVGLYASLTKQTRANPEQRALLESANSLRSYLNEQREFDDVYQWARGTSPKELLYVTYRSDANGTPNANGPEVMARWLEADNPAEIEANYGSSAEGRWIRARLNLSPSNNPEGFTEPDKLPPEPRDYRFGYVAFVVQLDIVPNPRAPFPDEPKLTIPMVLNR